MAVAKAQAPIGLAEFITLMAFLMSVTAVSIDAMLPALGIMASDLHAEHPNQAQYIISALFAGLSIGQLISGTLSDAIGRTKTLYLGMSLYLLGSLLCYFSHSMELMLFGRFIQGLGVSGPYVSNVAIIRDKFSGREMAKLMSIIMMIFIMVPVLAPALGQGFLYLGSWRFIFVFYIIYALLITAWVFFRLEETLTHENRIALTTHNFKRNIITVLTTRITVFYALSRGLVFGAMIGYLNSSQQIFQNLFAVGEDFYLYFGGLAFMLAVSSLINSRIVIRYGMQKICLVSTYIVICVSIAFLILNLLTPIHLWMFLLYATLIFLNMGFMFGNLNALSMEPMGKLAGTAAAIIGSVSTLLSIILGTLIGQLYDGTLLPLVSGLLMLHVASLLCMHLAEK